MPRIHPDPYQPNELHRQMVLQGASDGVPLHEIAAKIIDPLTNLHITVAALVRHYGPQVTMGSNIKDQRDEERKARARQLICDDQQMRDLVRTMAAYGVPKAAIARSIKNPRSNRPITTATLEAKFAEELEDGDADGQVAIARSLHQLAVGRDAQYDVVNGERVLVKKELQPQPGPAIFLGKVRLGMRETQVIETHSTITHQIEGALSNLSYEQLQSLRAILAKPAEQVEQVSAGGLGSEVPDGVSSDSGS